jgi:zinc protease
MLLQLRSLAAAGLLFICLVSTALADPPPSEDIPDFAAIAHSRVPTDTSVRTGVLPNGLRYALKHADLPKGSLSIRLGVDAGSFDDPDGDLGVAHFVEHMAFRSTRHYPDNSVDGAFAKSGVAFGRDQNAVTEVFTTAFSIDLPKTDDALRQNALLWLRDVADGVVFDPAAVETERGVVLAEKEARDADADAAYWALQRFRTPGLQSVDRPPIGLDATVRSLSIDRIKAFYQRWYRPDNAVIVMAGDLPLDVMEADVRRSFGSWTASGPAPQHRPYGSIDADRGLDVFSTINGADIPRLDVCRLGPPDPKPLGDYADLRKSALAAIWRETLNQRLAQLRLAPDNHIIGARFVAPDRPRDHREVCLSIVTTDAAWAPGLAAAHDELRRFQTSGPTDLEVDQAIDAVRAKVRGEIDDAPNRTASTLADAILTAMADGQPFPDLRQRLRGYDLAVESVAPADVRAAFNSEWTGGGPLVSLVAPNVPAPAQIKQAWLADERRPDPPAYVDRKVVKWAYTFQPPGKIVAREPQAFGAFVRLRFANGVVLNFKHTTFRKGYVAFVVSFGSGRPQLANTDVLTALLGGPLVAIGGVGKHSFEDLAKFAQTDYLSLVIHMSSRDFFFTESEPVANMGDELKVFAALLQDPAFRPSLDPLLREAAALSYRRFDTSPPLVAAQALGASLAPGNPLLLPPEGEFLKTDSKRLADIFRPVMTQGPIHVALVGDIDEATAIDLVANSLGALAPRPPPGPAPHDVFYLHYPQVSPPVLHAEHHGPPDKAFAELNWPLYVATPERRREEYSLKLLAAIFANELRRKVRGDLGKTYAPTVATTMPDHADQGVLSADIESYPGDLDALVAAARVIARTLASGAITQAEFEAARAPLLEQGRRDLETNTSWALSLAISDVDPEGLHELLDYIGLLSDLRLDDITKAAARWLAQEPVVVLAAPAKAKAGAP